MSSNDRTLALLTQLALATDGAVAGVALAYVAIQTWRNYNSNSSALHKIQAAPSLRISDLRSLLLHKDNDQSQPSGEKNLLVIVRGVVESKSAVDGNWRSLRPNVLVAHESGDKGVVLERTETCIYHEWKGLFGWTLDLRSIIGMTFKDQKSTSLRTVPFVLVDSGQWPSVDNVIVNLESSTHPLPLSTVYSHLEPVHATPYTFLQAMFGHAYPVGVLHEEKILPLGKEISAVGICTSQDGNPQMKSCDDLPYFLSDMNKDQMVIDLTYRTKVLFWSGIVFGSLSLGILGYAITRNWRRWKAWRQQRQDAQSRDAAVAAATDIQVDEETGEVPEGQLCVICLMRRRRSAFVPCGHMVCCHRCALAVERELAPKCPVCRQTISRSVRIYDS